MPSISRALGSAALVGTLFFGTIGCGGSSSNSSADFCKLAKSDKLKDLEPGDKGFAEAFKALQDKAPKAIEKDIDFFGETLEKITAAGDDPAKIAKVQDTVDEKRFNEANTNIEKYLKDECGIDN